MRMIYAKRAIVLAVAAVLAGAPVAHALDSNEVSEKSSPFALFKFAFKSYKKGKKDDAIEAYRYAAEKGHAGAQWKLARMYDMGDGVAEDDYQAFQIYEKIVRQGIDPVSPDGSYVSSALVSLARYLRNGITGTPVQANPAAARDLYAQAAWSFRDPDAQFELGQMFLVGDGGDRDVKQAFNLFRLSSEKGHAGGMAMFGDLLFQNGKTVRGLASLTAALQRSAPKDRGWIAAMQEQAFALAGESDRRTAMALADEIIRNGQ
ncbi:MAG: tetratricopeptide repeat protein [Rhizobiaceae bacterium]